MRKVILAAIFCFTPLISLADAASDDVRSYALSTVVGNLTKFVFADTYPNMAAWSAAKSAADSDEGKAIEATFENLMECTKNRLFESTEH